MAAKFVHNLHTSGFAKVRQKRTGNERGFLFIESNIQMDTIENSIEMNLKLKKSGKPTIELEKEIDAIVYQMYGLTEDEVRVVEGRK